MAAGTLVSPDFCYRIEGDSPPKKIAGQNEQEAGSESGPDPKKKRRGEGETPKRKGERGKRGGGGEGKMVMNLARFERTAF